MMAHFGLSAAAAAAAVLCASLPTSTARIFEDGRGDGDGATQCKNDQVSCLMHSLALIKFIISH